MMKMYMIFSCLVVAIFLLCLIFESKLRPTNLKYMELPTITIIEEQTVKNIYSSYYYYRNPLILFYTSWFDYKPWPFMNYFENYTTTCGCNFDNCKITIDNKKFENADVVVFHNRDMPSIEELDDIDKRRKNNQLWLYFSMENPFHHPSVLPLNRFFNLTMTYRLRSDYYYPYERYIKKQAILNGSISLKPSKPKTKLIAWFVSNCGQRRDKIIHYFEEHGLTVNVGGKCKDDFKNHIECLTSNCFDELDNYKFYFAAENDLCEDYITEKYWRNPIKINAVPIVLGGANYSDPRLAIPGSFINVFDFKSPKMLVDYIKLLDQNDSLYYQYFEWKKHYEIFQEKNYGCSLSMCELCENLKKGIKKQNNVLVNHIRKSYECENSEKFFDEWITR